MSTIEQIHGLIYGDNAQGLFDLAHTISQSEDVEELRLLIDSLRDDYDYYDEMSVLLHALERSNPDGYYGALRVSLPSLYECAPEWCRAIVKRNMMPPPSAVDSKFSPERFLREMNLNPDAGAIVAKLSSAGLGGEGLE